MQDKDGGKNIFDRMVDAVSSRDEQAALEKTQKELEQAKKDLQAARTRMTAGAQQDAAQRAAANKAVSDAQARAEAAEKRVKEMEDEARRRRLMEQQEEVQERRAEMQRKAMEDAAARAAAAPKFMGEHTVVAGDTLGAIALKFYGKATKPYYMAIYEANKATIGDSPNVIKPGQKLNIPVLPEGFEG